MGASAKRTSRLARVYAEALMANASTSNTVDAVGDELAVLVDRVLADPNIASFVASPVIGWRAKEPALLGALSGRASGLLKNFVGVLNRNGRLGMLPEIQAAYHTLQDAAAGRVPVTVKTAVPIGDSQRQALEATLAKTLRKTPVLIMIVDPDLLGGIVVQVGDRVMDASVRTRIQTLRAQLMERGSSYVLQN